MPIASVLAGALVCLVVLLLAAASRRTRRRRLTLPGRATPGGWELTEHSVGEVARRLGAAGALARGPLWLGLRDARGGSVFKIARGAVEPATSPPRLPLASITKPLVAHLAWDLARRGLVDLRRPIGEHARLAGVDRAIHRASLIDLLTHTAGAPRLPPAFPTESADPYAGYDRVRLLADLVRQPLRPSSYQYSNFGYAIAGLVLEEAAGAPFTVAMDAFLHELGLKGTSFARPSDEGFASAGLPVGAGRIWSFDAFAPAGGAFAPVDDLLAYGDLVRTRVELAPLLFPWRQIGSSGSAIGLAWHLSRRDGIEIPWHNGRAGAFSSFVGFSREAGVVIAALGDTSVDLAPPLIAELAATSREFLGHP